jgi:ABC-type polysaccharide/polyol phosphate export permease
MSVFIYKTLVKNAIVYMHYFAVYALVLLIYSIPVTPHMLLLLPGLAIVELNGLWVVALLGVICTRFRDVQQMISSLVVLLFFITPVFWPSQLIAEYREIIVFNPFYHLLELMRAPLLGHAPEPLSWLVGLGIAVAGMAVTLPVFARFRSRIVFWL